MSVWNKNRGTTDYGLRNTTRTQSVVPVLYWLNPVPQDSSEYSVQLYPSNSISDFRLVEKHERALIDTPAVWYGVALRESHKTFQAQTSTCIGMRQSVPLYSTRSGNSKLSSFLGIGRFLDLFRRIYYPCTYITLPGGGDSHVTRTGMFGVNSKENLQKISARSLRRLLHFFLNL